MVIPDWSARPRPPKIELAQELTDASGRLARPLDRLAAVIIDVFIVLAPFYILMSAPLKRRLMTSFLLNSEPDMFMVIFVLVLLAVGMLVAYQALCHHRFGATVGKYVMGIKVVAVFSEDRLSFWHAFTRAALWVIEAALLGLPWLAVFANGRRRVWHDRISDTVVISPRGTGVAPPEAWERSLVRGAYAAVLVFACLALVQGVRGTLEQMRLERSFLALAERETGECEIVSKHSEEKVTDHARLALAMSLYAAGLADRSCLEAEVEREVASQVPVGPVTYLAQAFIYADDAEISNAYLDRVCDDAPDTSECAMSRLVTRWSEEDWAGVDEILRGISPGSGYLEVWGVRHYMKQADYASALQLLDAMTSRRELADFSLSQRVKALFNAYRESEARAALAQAVLALPPDESRELGAWVCAQELQSGCGSLQSPACRQLDASADIDYQNSSEALARVLTLECKAQADYASLGDSAPDDDWRTFFRANIKRQRDDRTASAALFAKVLESDSAPEILRVEAARRWLNFASGRQMDQVTAIWRDLESKESWVKTGNLLFSRLAEMDHPETALRVARSLASTRALSPKNASLLAMLLENENRSGAELRGPAGVKVREQVRQLLDAFGRGD